MFFFGGHSSASPGLSVVFIVLALFLFMMRARARGGGGYGRGRRGGPWGGGGQSGGGSRPDDPPTQWDIRKPENTAGEGTDVHRDPPPQAPGAGPNEGSQGGPSDVQNPPSDL
jgi:hypothetical protein